MTMPLPPELRDDPFGDPLVGAEVYDFLKQWEQEDPFGSYYERLLDYLAKKVQEDIDSGKSLEEVNEKWIGTKDKPGIATKALEDAEFKQKIGIYPVQSMPFYEEVQAEPPGERVRAAFGRRQEAQQGKILELQQGVFTPEGRRLLGFAVDQGLISEEDATVNNPYYQQWKQTEQAGGKEALKRGVTSSVGRKLLQDAVDRGLMTEQEAYDDNPYYQDYAQKLQQGVVAKEQAQRLGQYEEGQEALGSPNSTAARMALRDAVARGEITQEQAYGPGSAWEKWQHGLGEQTGQGLAMGAPTTPEQRQMQAQQAVAEGAANENARKLAFERQGKIASSLYPDIYKQWEGMKLSPTNWSGDFFSWLNAKGDADNPLTPQQEQAQRTMNLQELEKWRTYGDIYDAYNDYLDENNEPEIDPIDKWITRNPQINLAWQQRQDRMRTRKQPYARWR